MSVESSVGPFATIGTSIMVGLGLIDENARALGWLVAFSMLIATIYHHRWIRARTDKSAELSDELKRAEIAAIQGGRREGDDG